MSEGVANIFYFTGFTIMAILCFTSVVFPYPQEYTTKILGSWEWKDMPTPRLIKCAKIVLVSALGNALIHFICRCCYRTFSDRYYTMPFESRVTLSEKVLSSIHGFILGTTALNLLLVQQVWLNDVFGQFPVMLDYLFCYSIGYEIYDLGTMILQDLYVPKYNEGVFWVHHTSMIIGYVIVLFKRKMAFGAVLLMVTEITVLPSNAHWYLKASCNQDTRAFHFNQGLRLWCFLIFRLFIAPLLFVTLAWNYHQFWYEEDVVTKVAVTIITTLLGSMNIMWTKTMAQLYRKRTRLRDKRIAKLQKAQTDKNK